MIILVPFHMIARACLPVMDSSASTEKLFSDLGKIGNNQCQSLFPGILYQSELIRVC